MVDDEIVVGETVDVSADGLHVTCDDPVPMNEPITMTIAPPGRELIRVTVKVVWSDLDGIDMENRAVGMGLCFLELSDENRKAFDDALAGDRSE